MEQNKKAINMDSPNLELVLTELLEENRQINLNNNNIIEVINRLTDKVDKFQEQLKNIKLSAPEIDTRSIKEIIEKSYMDLNKLLDQKLIRVHESNWKVFWMSNAKTWIVYLILGTIFLTYAYFLLKN
jgi:hypothetical protein